MTIAKRDIPQAVFDSKDAIRVINAGHRQACAELDNTPRYLLSEGNPNHPQYDLMLFGQPAQDLISRQYKGN